MWYDDPFVKLKNSKGNRRNKRGRTPILMVNARLTERRRERAHRVAAVGTLFVALMVTTWGAAHAARLLRREVFTENARYRIDHLEFTSDSKVIPDRLIAEWAAYQDPSGAWVQVRKGDNLFAVDLASLRESMLKQYVVKQAIVRRKLPDTLSIHVVRRMPIARLGPDSLPYTFDVDREGYLVGRSGETSAKLPRVLGIDPDAPRGSGRLAEPMALRALELIDLCATSASLSRLVQIVSVGVGHPDYLQVELATGEFVMFGPDNMKDRLAKLARILEDAASRGEHMKLINLTVDKNIAFYPAP